MGESVAQEKQESEVGKQNPEVRIQNPGVRSQKKRKSVKVVSALSFWILIFVSH
jgi:hypothetical protein